MAKKNFYAIEAGGEKHIVTSWDECCKIRDANPSNARYKGFATRPEAEAFLGEAEETPGGEDAAIGVRTIGSKHLSKDPKIAIVYTDGSYNIKTGVCGYGVLLFPSGREDDKHDFIGSTTMFSEHRNVTGECQGAIRGVREALAMGYEKVELYFDYAGIAAWATGDWRTKNRMTQEYAAKMRELSKSIVIEFHKVAGHTGVKYNEYVDRLAKSAVGVAVR